MKTTVRIAFLIAAMFITTVGDAGGLDGKWSSFDGRMTLIFSNNGANVTHHLRGWPDQSFHTSPFKENGVQWMESGGGAGMVYAAEPKGNKLDLVLIGGDQAGHSSWNNVTLTKVSN